MTNEKFEVVLTCLNNAFNELNAAKDIAGKMDKLSSLDNIIERVDEAIFRWKSREHQMVGQIKARTCMITLKRTFIMKRIERLRVDNHRSVTFIFGELSTVKAFSFGKYTPNLKMSLGQAVELYNKFVSLGAQVIF